MTQQNVFCNMVIWTFILYSNIFYELLANNLSDQSHEI